MTSPPLVVASARQIMRLIEFLKNLTLPSVKSALTPPAW